MTFWDIISLSLYPLMFTPGFGFVYSLNILFIYQLIGVIICSFLIKLTRWTLPKNSITLRPVNAANCNIYNQGGVYNNRIGMPSGHVLLTTFILFSLGYINYKETFYLNNYFLLCLVWIVLMAVSRVKRNCHTVLQVIMGAAFGYILYIIWVKILTVIKKNDK
jgi:membrane-associated phospholipid phosphatase